MPVGFYGSGDVLRDGVTPTAINAAAAFLMAVATFKLVLLLVRRTVTRKSPPLPPGPLGLPVLGYLPFIRDDLHLQFLRLADTYGPVYKLWLGKKIYVIVSSPSLVKEIVREQDVTFPHRSPNLAAMILTYGGKDIGFADYSPYWKDMRKLFVREIMSPSVLDECYSLRREEVRKSVAKVNQMASTPVDIGQNSLLTLINAMMAMLWGSTLEGLKAESAASEFKTASAKYTDLLAQPNVSDLFPILSRFDLQGVAREAKKLNLWFDQFLDSVIECANRGIHERNSSGSKDVTGSVKQRTDLLQLILELLKKDDGNSAPMANNRDLKGILMDIVVGGTETTATSVEWAMAELLQHPDIMKNVVEELTAVVGMDSMVEERHLPELKYLDAVIKETVRLHPPLPLMVPRNPNKTCVVGGYTIPKGCTVFIHVGHIHRDPKLWDKPLDFLPERFLKDPRMFDFSGNNFAYLPFGSGRRICAGLPLAEKMLTFVLATFLHSFDWELPEGTPLDLSDQMGLVVRKKTSLIAIPRPRLPNGKLYEQAN